MELLGIEEHACKVCEVLVLCMCIYGVREWAADCCSWVCYKCVMEGLEPIWSVIIEFGSAEMKLWKLEKCRTKVHACVFWSCTLDEGKIWVHDQVHNHVPTRVLEKGLLTLSARSGTWPYTISCTGNKRSDLKCTTRYTTVYWENFMILCTRPGTWPCTHLVYWKRVFWS